MSTSELATSYAALILADDGVEITVSKSLFLFSFFYEIARTPRCHERIRTDLAKDEEIVDEVVGSNCETSG